MSIKVRLNHNTQYTYSSLVSLTPHLIRLRPAPHCLTQIQRYSLKIEPKQHSIHWQQDPFNNYIARLTFSEQVSELSLDVEIIANIAPVNVYDFLIEDYATLWPFAYTNELTQDLKTYLYTQTSNEQLNKFLAQLNCKSLGTLDFLTTLNQHIYNSLTYVERLEPGVQTCETSLSLGSGSCRDSAWLLVELLRHVGLAARFVSGYSIQLADSSSNVESSANTDSTDLHAWTEVYIPGAGWIGLDPSSGLLAGQGYIPLCCTRDPKSAAPVSGFSSNSNATLHFENTVTRLL